MRLSSCEATMCRSVCLRFVLFAAAFQSTAAMRVGMERHLADEFESVPTDANEANTSNGFSRVRAFTHDILKGGGDAVLKGSEGVLKSSSNLLLGAGSGLVKGAGLLKDGTVHIGKAVVGGSGLLVNGTLTGAQMLVEGIGSVTSIVGKGIVITTHQTLQVFANPGEDLVLPGGQVVDRRDTNAELTPLGETLWHHEWKTCMSDVSNHWRAAWSSAFVKNQCIWIYDLSDAKRNMRMAKILDVNNGTSMDQVFLKWTDGKCVPLVGAKTFLADLDGAVPVRNPLILFRVITSLPCVQTIIETIKDKASGRASGFWRDWSGNGAISIAVGGGVTLHTGMLTKLAMLGFNRAEGSLAIVIWPLSHAGNVVAEVCTGTDTVINEVEVSVGLTAGLDRDNLGGQGVAASVKVDLPGGTEIAANVGFEPTSDGSDGFMIDSVGLEWSMGLRGGDAYSWVPKGVGGGIVMCNAKYFQFRKLPGNI